MPTVELMGWNKTQKRWYKRYRGRLYFVSPRQLKCQPNKDASRTAANEWWERKQREIDEQLGQAKQHPVKIVKTYNRAIENNRLFAKWQHRYGTVELANKADAAMDLLTEGLKSDGPPFPLNPLLEDPTLLDNPHAGQTVPVEWHYNHALTWKERFDQIRREERAEHSTPKENTIRAYIDDYLALKHAQIKATKKVVSYFSLKHWLMPFRNWAEPLAPIDAINEALWTRYYVYLSDKVASGEYKPRTAKHYFNQARAFITHCWENGYIDRPRNLVSRSLVFQAPIEDPVVFTKNEITVHLEAANPRTKLYVLLMLNCGMYGSDISNLLQSEVDWETGRIFRKRTKTRDKSPKVPKVDYPLWKTTFELLKQFRSDHPAFVLLNENGEPLVADAETTVGKQNHKNNVKSAIFRLQYNGLGWKRAEQRKPLKTFRKTGATLLEQSEYGRFSEHYLGEAPQTVASRHYSHKKRIRV